MCSNALIIDPPLPGPCDYLWNVTTRTNHDSSSVIFEAPRKAETNITVRLHLITNDSLWAADMLHDLNNWIELQRSSNTSLLRMWINQTGIDLSDIKFNIYLPLSYPNSSQLLEHGTKLIHLNELFILNDTDWNNLGSVTFTINSSITNFTQSRCRREFKFVFDIAFNVTKNLEITSDDSCHEILRGQKKCVDVFNYFETLCNLDLMMGDIIQFKYLPTILHDNITILIYKHHPIPEKVYETKKNEGHYILQKDGGYRFQLQGSLEQGLRGTFTYIITKTCENVTNLTEDWLQSNYLNPRHINILLTDNRILPITYGHEEYITLHSAGTLLLIKRIVRTLTNQLVLPYLAQACGAEIRKEGNF